MNLLLNSFAEFTPITLVRGKMEVAIIAGLFAKGDMEIDSGHENNYSKLTGISVIKPDVILLRQL